MKNVESMWEQSQQITAGGGNIRWRQDSKWMGAREVKKTNKLFEWNEMKLISAAVCGLK